MLNEIKIIKNNYLKKLKKKKRTNKKNKPAVFKLAKPVLLVFLAAANSGSVAQLFSVLTSTRAASGPALQ